jgi:hypothetical protein
MTEPVNKTLLIQDQPLDKTEMQIYTVHTYFSTNVMMSDLRRLLSIVRDMFEMHNISIYYSKYRLHVIGDYTNILTTTLL